MAVLVVLILFMDCARSNRDKFHLRMYGNLADSARQVHEYAANNGRFPFEVHLEHDHLTARTGLAMLVLMTLLILMTLLVLMTLLILMTLLVLMTVLVLMAVLVLMTVFGRVRSTLH